MVHRTVVLGSVAAALTFAGCGGGGGGKASPAAVAKSLQEAGADMDAAAVAGLFPTAAQLDAAMTCEPGAGPHEAIARQAKAWAKDVDEIHEDFVEFVKLEERGDPEIVIEGADYQGCRAKTEIRIQRARLHFKTKSGEDDSEGLAFIKLGDAGWFALR